eukprot:TRINITY_DN19550_c0_g1_i1.p1 TRINITY_DN19550_c0_g1~~TRINITY_DN19550_c0_g1_i1.p1  ORF type:complete len:194 (-),score=38.27 TRINITY_DN19550_c0_g1_i1:673-1254(-)
MADLPLPDAVPLTFADAEPRRDLPLAVLVLLSVIVVELSSLAFGRLLSRDAWGLQERKLLKELKELRRKAEDLITPDTFAQAAKMQRAAAAKEKEVQKLREERARGQIGAIFFRFVGPLLLQSLAYSFLVWHLWRQPMVLLPPGLLSPLGRVLSFPFGTTWQGGGAVAILPWLAVCTRVCKTLTSSVGGKARR